MVYFGHKTCSDSGEQRLLPIYRGWCCMHRSPASAGSGVFVPQTQSGISACAVVVMPGHRWPRPKLAFCGMAEAHKS